MSEIPLIVEYLTIEYLLVNIEINLEDPDPIPRNPTRCEMTRAALIVTSSFYY